MAEPAKWIKISTDTFEDEKIDIIEGMPNGEKIIMVWFKILLLAGKCNAGGYLLLQDDIPFTPEMLARRFKQEINIINQSLDIFEKYKMIQITDTGIYISNFNRYQDLDKLNQKREQARTRKQKQRAIEKLLQETTEDEVVVAENNMSRVTERDNECDIQRENERDSSTSTTSISISNNSSSNNINKSNNCANIKDVFEAFGNNIHLASPIEREKLLDWCNAVEPQVVILAIEQAVLYNVRNIGYINSVLNSWFSKGLITVEAVEADKRDFKDKQKKKLKNKNPIKSQHSGYKKNSNFNNFQQRELDPEIEKQLLEKSSDTEIENPMDMLKEIRGG